MADQVFTQTSGPRAGQKYRIKRGASGLNIKVYESGDTALQNKTRQPASTRGGFGGGAYAREQRRRYNPNQ